MVTQPAGPKLAGYIYQFHRALYRVFSSEYENGAFSIETEDDVVEINHLDSGEIEIIFEQDKANNQKTGQPYQNSSKNFWHTLHIWLDAMSKARESYDLITYCFVTNKAVGAKTLAMQLSDAHSSQEIALAISALTKKAKEIPISSEAKESSEKVINYPIESLEYLIKNLVTLDENGTKTGNSPQEATIQLLHIPISIQNRSVEIYQNLLGKLVQDCETAWKTQKNATFTKTPYANLLHELKSSFDLDRYVERSFLSSGYRQLMQKNKDIDHLFIQQLQRIGSPDESCDQALSHYWGFYSERIRLLDEGNVLEMDFEERNGELHERWLTYRNSAVRKSAGSPLTNTCYGEIYDNTLSPDYLAKIGRHNTSNSYFTSGNYHELANIIDNEFYIFWHNDFKKGGRP